MTKRNIKLVIEYEGTTFAGWQLQSDEKTIQGEVVGAIKRVTGREVNLIGAGRTDAGVHALGQVANFEIEHDLEARRFAPALNFYLPSEIKVKSSTEVSSDFNARFSAVSKRYRYLIGLSDSALFRNQRWAVRHSVSVSLLKEAAAAIVGEHDFAPFCVVSSLKLDNRCLIHSAVWRQIGDLLIFEIRGNRFLHNMVRILVGAMVNLAGENPDKNKLNLTLDTFKNIILSSETQRVVFTAPPQGLYLVSVQYSKEDQDEILHRHR